MDSSKKYSITDSLPNVCLAINPVYSFQPLPSDAADKSQVLLKCLQCEPLGFGKKQSPLQVHFKCTWVFSVSPPNGYQPTWLRSSVPSFELHLKKRSYSASVINDLDFWTARKVLQSKQKQLKKQEKGNKPNASVALTSSELKTFYDKVFSWGTFKRTVVKQQSLLWPPWVQRTSWYALGGCKATKTANVTEWSILSSMTDKQKLELDQTVPMSGQYHRKCATEKLWSRCLVNMTYSSHTNSTTIWP